MDFPGASGGDHHKTPTVRMSQAKGGKKKKKKKPVLETVPDSIAAGRYLIKNEVGKGQFGRVFRSLNTHSGEVVAVKTMSTSRMNESQKVDMMNEVNLMKELPTHEHVVRYIDSVVEGSFLFIVMEFIENKSLKVHFQQFDEAPAESRERLAALFIFQILLGLDFLHDQCVIHRDIKAANVLVTAGGVAKLTDFGVATRDNTEGAGGDVDVAGTPYWMAPEIIEMSSPTPACDIWSVGATAIELYAGRPPYFHMAPMAAMFRIVQDASMPIPTGISTQFENFLNRCFVREASVREPAKELMTQSTWFKRHLQDTKYAKETGLGLEPAHSGGAGAAKGKSKQSMSKKASGRKIRGDISDDSSSDLKDDEMAGMTDTMKNMSLKYAKVKGEEKKKRASAKFSQDKVIVVGGNAGGKKASSSDKFTMKKPSAKKVSLSEEESSSEETDDDSSWGSSDESDDSTPVAKKKSTLTSSAAEEKAKSILASMVTAEATSASARDLHESSVSDDDFFESDDADAGGGDLLSNFQKFGIVSADGAEGKAEEDDDDDWGDEDDDINYDHLRMDVMRVTLRAIDELITESDITGGASDTRGLSAMSPGSVGIVSATTSSMTSLTSYPSGSSGAGGLSVSRRREEGTAESVERLKLYFDTINEEYKKDHNQLVQLINTSVIPIMELLQSRNIDVLNVVIGTVELLVSDEENGKLFLESLCLVQFVPVVGRMLNDRGSQEIVQKGEILLRILCDSKKSSPFSRKMFIAAGGIEILTDCIKKKYVHKNKGTIFTGIDCCLMLFLEGGINKKDLARLFVKAGTMSWLMMKFKETVDDIDGTDLKRIIGYSNDLAHLFMRVCKSGDRVVKKMISEGEGKHGTLTILLATFPALMASLRERSGDTIIADESMSRQASVLHILEGLEQLSRNAIGISALMKHSLVKNVCPFLDIPTRNSKITQYVTMILYNMTVVSGSAARAALAEAANNEALGHLIRLHRESTDQMVRVYVETLTRFAKNATDDILLEMRKYNMAELYLRMTEDSNISTRLDGFTALSSWMNYPDQGQRERLETILINPDNVTSLIQLFAAPVSSKIGGALSRLEKHKSQEWAPKALQLVEAFTQLMKPSKLLVQKFGESDLFLKALSAWLESSLDRSLLSTSEKLAHFTKTLVEFTSQFLDKLDRDEAKKFHQEMLPTVDKILVKNRDKGMIRIQIESKLLKNIATTLTGDDSDLLSGLSDYTTGLIRNYFSKLGEPH